MFSQRCLSVNVVVVLVNGGSVERPTPRLLVFLRSRRPLAGQSRN